jgi:NitT/TauT family transport system substrate-binding protein
MNRQHRRFGRLLTALVAVTLLAAACGDDDEAESSPDTGAPTTTAPGDSAAAPDTTAPVAAEPVPVRIAAIIGAGQGIFSTVMVENGIDEELGLDVEVVPISATGQQWLSIRDGSADVAAGSMLDLLRQREAGLDVTSINSFQTYVNPVLVKADSPIQSLADLRSRKVGTPAVSLLDFMILRAAGKEAQGIDVGVDATPVPAAPNLLNALLENGEVDAILQFDSLAVGPLAAGTFREVSRIPDLMEEAGFNRDAFYTTFNVSSDWVNEYPDSVGALAEAFTRTFELLQTDDAAWDPVLEEVGITDEAAKQGFIAAQRAITGPPYTSELLEPTRELVDALVAVAGPQDVGITEFDVEAFSFPNE